MTSHKPSGRLLCCDYLLLAFQIVRSQPEEILLICETLRLSGSHTLVATADLPVQELGKCGQPHGRVRTPPTAPAEAVGGAL